MTDAEKELEDVLVAMVRLDCHTIDMPTPLHSYGHPVNADALRLLARRGRIVIDADHGDLVTGRWVTR